jgi:hypothetical protein
MLPQGTYVDSRSQIRIPSAIGLIAQPSTYTDI